MAESGPPGTEFNNENFEKLVALSDNLRFFSNSAIRSQLDAAAQRVETARVTLYWIWGTSSVFVAAFVVIFAWFIAKPIRRIDSHIRRLGQGHFDETINIEGPSDIAELGARLDWLRNRLGEVDQIKERFFREMSHQLKTPLASIREGADLLKDESVRGDPDRQDDFVAFNCAAIPTDLLESELFGYRKGAFSGATRNHPGLFEQAHKGTLLLDEIGDMPKILQAKVLRVIEDGKVRPLGSEQVVDVDARIISATNRNLEEAMEAGEFREDLFYRLNVVSVDLPSLSDRIEDIPPLAASRLHRLAEEAGSSRNSFSPKPWSC